MSYFRFLCSEMCKFQLSRMKNENLIILNQSGNLWGVKQHDFIRTLRSQKVKASATRIIHFHLVSWSFFLGWISLVFVPLKQWWFFFCSTEKWQCENECPYGSFSEDFSIYSVCLCDGKRNSYAGMTEQESTHNWVLLAVCCLTSMDPLIISPGVTMHLSHWQKGRMVKSICFLQMCIMWTNSSQ